ncbi:non-ribosomal peptide synthetase [Eleftheria terrae]|uniref:non-ribosomal peptide synthetase n=1 Tax=Eleftheria terrae TaxID=1597781 RepID=UPI00263A6E27|nr:non-ribosomal peptide synthase/polyketide synthase [Eleftheria terrae]WKB55581.1 non-ribosomal peptide synthase/polyketide synthase [Eleftheria terrae]
MSKYDGSSEATLSSGSAPGPLQVPAPDAGVMSEQERRQVLTMWNDTACDYPQDRCIHELFEGQADRAPQALALACQGEQLSYRALDELANQLAHHLRALGVGPDARVAICMPSGLQRMTAVLATWKAGGAYVPLDPAYPVERLEYMVRDSAPTVLLTHADVAAGLRASLREALPPRAAMLDVQADAAAWSAQPRSRLPRSAMGLEPHHLAYVIYTSGSTGQPKGVMVEHRGVCNLATAQVRAFAVEPDSRILQCASFSFDACLFEMVMALCNGASLHLPAAGAVVAGTVLTRLLVEQRITHATLTPSVLAAIDDPGCLASVRTLVVAGEACPPALVERWAFGRRFINAYGPTETTVWATWHECRLPVDGRPPIGRPIANMQVYVLDEQRRPVPVGVPGELYIGGAGVARGYLNREALTRERFVEDPFATQPAGRLYKTGDLACWRADGTLDYLGRNDQQVKLRGLRIELGEIEAQLVKQPGVREAAVLVREDVPGDKRLVAYVVAGPQAQEIDPHALRQALARTLPEYMVPAAYVALPTLPMTPNGKLDRQALPAPQRRAFAQRAYVAPQDGHEAALADVWQELLRVERIGRDDHFFELGGHSLLAVQMSSRLRQRLEREVAVSSLFAHPVLRDFAAVVEQAPASQLPVIVPGRRPEQLPLSFAQQRLWFIARMGDAARAAYHLSVGMQLRGALDEAALQAALDRIVQRHEALRTHFDLVDGQPVQRIVEASGLALVRHDVAAEGRSGVEAVAHWQRIEAEAPFDLAQGPLIRGRLLRLGAREHVLLLTMHHIVSDGWSQGVLTSELAQLYRAYALEGVDREVDPLPALPVQYADYAVWQREWLAGEVQQRQLAFWRDQLASAPALVTLPTDRPRPAVQDYRGQSLPVEFSPQLSAALKALSQRHGTTLYMTLLAAWGALVARLAGQDEVVIGTPVANRTRAEVEPLIGFFVNTLALRLDFSDRPSVAQLLAQVREQVLQAQSHQDLPFEQVVEALRPQRTLAHSPIFQLMFAWQNAPRTPFELQGLSLEEMAVQPANAKFDLTLELQEAQDRITGTLCFATALFEAATMQRHVGYLEALLRGMVQDEAQAVDAIPIVGEAERQQVLLAWNDTKRPYPQGLCVHELFERRAAGTPEAVAVEHEGRRLSYQALDEQANRLAHQLRALGVGAEDRVALCLRRGPELVMAMLAVLKAGAAYVPLDPAYPPQRWQHMLSDSAPRVVLTQVELAASGHLSGEWTVLEMDGEQRPWEAQPATPLPVTETGSAPERLAYVIYTSGSTGQPNGVMVEHRNLANLIGWHSEQFPLAVGERTSSTAGVAFDACTWEVWPALCMGATLVLPPAATVGDPAALLDWWQGEDLQTSFLVTALADAALSRGQADRRGLRQLLTGGDRLGRLPAAGLPFELVNNYGPTEATVVATSGVSRPEDAVIHIGRPIANTRLYLLDRHGQPVPVGAPGELYIGGVQVARGYLNRPELTRERFVADPFAGEPGARMYKTGDLGRWLPDGTVEYLGRSDHQVKIRGLRIELGEIEAQLARQPGVRESVVLAREDVPGEVRLVAYLVARSEAEKPQAQALREALSKALPEYMVPAAYVVLEALPLTPNGKVDRRALPVPDGTAFAQRAYEAPQGEVEVALAQIWSELLQVERVGRQDNFFELGGHSLLAVQLMERMRRQGLHANISTLFARPTLAALAQAVQQAGQAGVREVVVPPNAIPAGCQAITPQMLPLLDIDAEQIARIVAAVPGGAANVQDIYPLAPLQQGILFHHLLQQQGDPYLLSFTLAFDTRQQLDDFAQALQQVIDRHDILRTAVLWQGLDVPVQVVWREARLDVQTLDVADPDVPAALNRRADPGHMRLDLQRAPLMQGVAAFDPRGQRWLLQLVHHHLVLDHTALDVLFQEIALIQSGRGQELPAPMPFRNFVAQARLGVSEQEHEAFFRQMLGDVDEPTAPFGLLDVHGGGDQVHEAQLELDVSLSRRLRQQARSLGVSAASLFHWAWAQVLAKTTGREDVVFGTVLFGRLQGAAGTDRAMGLFINTLPIRVRLGDTHVREGVRQAHAALSGLVQHEHATLALAQRCSALPARTPLFSALLNYRHSAETADGAGKPGWTHGLDVVSTQERTSYPLDLSVDDLGENFGLSVQVAQPIDARRVCGYMQRALQALADALEQAPQTPSWRIDVLDEAERHQVLAGWNDTRNEAGPAACIHTLFEQRAVATPQATALEHEDRRLSYQALNERANQLAHHLRGLGVGPDERVAVCLSRSIEMVVAILAVLKAGGAYVPLDPAYPRERLQHMLRDAAPRLVLTQAGLDAAHGLAGEVSVLELDGSRRPWEALPASNPSAGEIGLAPHHLAYVIYTSGSTGQPKGVAVEHGPLCRRIAGLAGRYGLQASDRVLQFASINFDASVEEILGALTQGAALVLRTQEWLGSGSAFWRLCAASRITVADLPTQFWHHIVGDPAAVVPDSVRCVIIGGEAVDAQAVAHWVERAGHRPRLFNTYGPTETLVVATVQEVQQREDVHIGRPVADTAIYLLDRRGEPVPIGVPGEIHIGGAALARGYLNQPGLTRERFVPDPFAASPQARMYKSGDLGRWRADGTLEYLGRNDEQLKIRGFRIEPGEIEAALVQQAGVREARVLAREDAAGGQRLVAYLLGTPGAGLDPQALRQALAQQLPDYMVPAAYVVLPAWPLTPNGKLDRRALPMPQDAAFAQRAYEAPQGEVETVLARIWSHLLRVERVGRNDNFFELGGHSLLAVQLMERLRREELHADIRTLFAQPTLAALARAVEAARRAGWRGTVVPANAIEPGCRAITPAMLPLVELDAAQIERIVASVPGGAANVQDIYPLAPLQEGILFHYLLQTRGDPYLLTSTLSFESRERLDGFVQALQQVVDRHDALRTAVLWDGLAEPVQVVWREARLQVETLDLRGGDTAARLARHADPRHYRLDVRQAPLMRGFAAFDEASQRWLLQLLQHHLVMDHVTGDLMLEEIGLIQAGRAGELPAPVPFRNFVAEARLGVSEQEHEAFFRQMLGDVDEPTAPFGLQDVHGDGENVHEAQAVLAPALSQRLRRQARVLGVSAASLFHWAWAQVLAKTTGREDVVFGTVLFGRLQGGDGTDRAMGLFINTLPMRVRLGELGVQDGIRQTHATLSGLVRHEHAPLALAQRCSALPTGVPLFSALLNYRHSTPAGGEAATPAWAQGVDVLAVQERTNYPFTLSVDDLGEDFALSTQIAEPVEAQRVCEYMHNALERLVDALEQSPQTPSWQIDVLGDAERRQVLAGWNDTQQTWPWGEVCIHELFERQAAATPQAIALECEAQRLSYQALNERANQLAHHLRGLGVGPDERVAICLQRSVEMVVAILAVLKAGAAYVPLDPSYPRDRLDHMLSDSAPRVVLTQLGLEVARGVAGEAAVIDLDGPQRPWESQPATNLASADLGLAPQHLAYVIYTSGSTGLPKGVMVEHGGVVNRMAWMQQAYGMTAGDAVLQKTPFGFDVSVWEFFWPLMQGARLVMARPEGHKDPAYLAEVIQAHRITTVHFVPSLLQVFVDSEGASRCDSLRRVICSGEALPGVLARRVRQVLPQAGLHNLYGPTEATVDVTAWTCDAPELPDNIPIGAPIANTAIYVLAPHGQPVPAGVVGEIHIGGVQVARGYLNRPELTRERFVADPFATRPGARMYKTGDLGRWLPDGTVEYLGRNDHQVKIRGLRIELGEIEAQIGRQPGVQAVAVLAREDEPGDKRLVAYVVAAPAAAVDPQALRQVLARQLPDYMVPAAWVVLDALPLTPNGKLDRKALPAPQGAAAPSQRDYAAPQGPVESALALIWGELLRVGQVGRNDHFFELGGHSLLAVRMISRLRQRSGLDVPLASLFAHPVLHDFARVASETQATALPPLVPSERPEAIPLSFAQQRLWLAAQLGKEASAAYHMPIGLRLRGRLDEPALQATLDRIVQRHEVLRTHFERVDDRPVQRIGATARFALAFQDLPVEAGQRDAVIEHWSRVEAREPFDLGRGPLIRGRLLRLDAQDHVLLLTMHHTVSDGWSLGVLAEELSALYRAYAADGVAYAQDPLPPLPVQYADYALWQRRWLDAATQERLLTYWCGQLAGSPLLSALPTDHPRPPVQGFVGGMVYGQVPEATTAALHELAGRHTSTLFMVLMAAFNVLLSRYTGQTDLNVGTVVANRNRSELEPLIGLLLDTQVIRTRLDPAQSFESLLQQVRTTLIQGYLHQELPFDTLLDRLKPTRLPGVPPLFQVMLQMQNMPDQVVSLPELSLQVLPPSEYTVKFDLTLYVTERDGGLQVAYEYDAALFEAATIERLAARFTRLLEAVVAAPAARLDELGLPEPLPVAAYEVIAAEPASARAGLSPHQQRLWSIDRAEAGVVYEAAPTYHNLPLLLDLGEAVQAAQLEAALNIVVARHGALRARIGSEGSTVWQSVEDEAPLVLEPIELAEGDALLARAVAEVQRPFRLDGGRLVRAALLRKPGEASWLCVTTHHIVADRRSLQLLAHELVTVYAALVEGRMPEVPALTLGVVDHARWQSSLGPEVVEPWLLYWKQQLNGRLQAIELPLSRPRPATHRFSAGRHGFAIDAELGTRLRAVAQDGALSIEDVLLTGFLAVLRRYAGHDELVIGTSVAGRDANGLQGVVGPLSNLLVLRHTVPAEADFAALMAQVARTRTRAVQHGGMPFDLLVAKLGQAQATRCGTLFDIVFQYDEAAGQAIRSGAVVARPVETNLGHGSYDLHLCMFPRDGGFEARLVYNTELLEEALVAQMMRHFVRLLQTMTEAPQGRIDQAPMLDDAERERLCGEWNATDRAYPQDTFHARFEAQAARTPDAPALRYQEQELSYAQLNAKADRLARYLVDAGVTPGARVGIYLARSPALVIALLGVLKAGGAYVPLEPKLPKDRLAYMVQDAGIGWALLEADTINDLPLNGVDVVLMDGAATEPDWMDDYAQGELPSVAADDLAYVIYTSGSTGRPKGVMIEHRGLANYLSYAVETYLPGLAGSVVSSPLCFDATLTTLLPPLLAGKPVWLLPDDEHTLAHLSARLFAPGEGWLFKITPAHLEALSYLEREAASGPAPHCIVVGGEQLSSATLQRWKGELLPQARFVNEYGPTETVVGCSVWTLASAGQLPSLAGSAAAPIGRPIANTRLYVLGAALQLQPVGCVGELYIGGAGVARGYINQPSLTQERFIADPFGEGRLYKTGDLVRYRGDGELEFLGRIDEQVKIRGFRIELGEIEAQLMRQPGVREAVVLAREDVPGERRLVAYVVANHGAEPDALRLREALAQSLPDYMVPAAYVVLAALPVTQNGKLDRRALPMPEDAALAQRDYEAPQGPVETMLAGIWSELLRVERVGRRDNFFELGGNSLLALRLMGRLRREELQVDTSALFAHPTLAALAEAVEEARRAGSREVVVPASAIPAGCQDITPQMLPLIDLDAADIERIVATVPGGAANVQDIYPLAPLQEGILFHHLLQAQGDAYLLSTILAFDSRERLDGFVQALQQVIDRHDVLRTSIVWAGLREPVQVVWRQARFEVGTPDLPEGDTATRLAEQADPRRVRLDLQRAPLMRGNLAFDRNGGRWLLQLLHHHLALDHLALDVLLHEIGLILSGRAQELPAPVPFRNFVAQARLGVSAQEHEAFFRQMLGDVDEPTAPFGLLDVHGDGSNVHEAHLGLSRALSHRLRQQARTLGVSTASLFHWAWAQVLAKATGRDDVVFGTVLFGRLQGGAGTERAMGLFINTLPIRVRLGELGVQDGVRQTQAALSGLMRHEHASLALAQRCSALPAGTPLFSALFNYRHSAEAAEGAQTPDWAHGLDVLTVQERNNYPFMLSVDDLGEDFELSAQIAQPVEARQVCAYMHQVLERLADALEQAPQTPSWQLDVLGEAERRQLLATWNDTRADWPQEAGCLHELFERQSAATPHATALAHEDRRLSYQTLNQRANQLARHLRGLGVGPDTRVALCLQRSVEMVVAMLAVLKAGGAYVPLDPAYPRERLEYMLRDSAPRVVLTQAALDMARGEGTVLELDGPHRPWEALPADNLPAAELGLSPSHGAYVIYTSGSTGQPKGVMIEHANAVNFILWARQSFSVDELRHTLFSTSLNFDLAVFECFAPLSCGGCVHLVDNILALATRALPVSLINTVPSALQAVVSQGAVPASVRVVNVAGEPLKRHLVEELFNTTGVASLCNLYGPSETTTYSTWTRMARAEGFDPSIGRPVANTTVYLLDARGQLVPPGVVGEIFIGGAGVARGYLNQPQLTRERFVADPFATEPGARMYKTGDLGRWRADGRLDYLGRNDHQVKIRGFRIELGEIEARLLAQPGVREALVLAREDNPGDSKYLAAYVSGTAGNELDPQALRRALAEALPDYMVPAAWVVLPALPLTPNGKVDRKALPAPADTGLARSAHEPPQGDTETTLAQIWSELLRVQRVGRNDHFFELGGHSLLATQLISRVRSEWDIEISLATLFSKARLSEFSDAIVDYQLAQFDADALQSIVAQQKSGMQ